MQTTPTPGLLHQLSEFLQPRAQPQPQATNDSAPQPRKMVTAQRTVHSPVDQRTPPQNVPQRSAQGVRPEAPAEGVRNVPRGTFLNIVV